MRGKTAFNAMEGIDPRYILEAAPDAVIRKGSKAPYIRILAVAATVAVLTAVAVLGAGIMKQSGENPSVVPPVGETQDKETPTAKETDGTTTAPHSGEGELPPVLNGSYSTDLYTVTEIDGKHYISFADGNEKPTSESGSAGVVKGIYFNSLEEMRQKFLNGSFTEAELRQLKSELKLTDKGFEIPDMTNLYDAVLPEGWSVYRVCLDGNEIFLSIRNDQTYDESTEDYEGESGFIAIHTKQYYDTVYQYYFLSHVESNEKYLVQDETSFHGMPCRVFEHLSSNGILWKSVVMEASIGGGTVDVLVKYRIQESDTDGTSAPYSMCMYGEIYGQKIEVFLSGFESDPQGDFYQAFGIKPFETKE